MTSMVTLKIYAEGALKEEEIENWANSIERQDDIVREKLFEGLINQVFL